MVCKTSYYITSAGWNAAVSLYRQWTARLAAYYGCKCPPRCLVVGVSRVSRYLAPRRAPLRSPHSILSSVKLWPGPSLCSCPSLTLHHKHSPQAHLFTSHQKLYQTMKLVYWHPGWSQCQCPTGTESHKSGHGAAASWGGTLCNLTPDSSPPNTLSIVNQNQLRPSLSCAGWAGPRDIISVITSQFHA